MSDELVVFLNFTFEKQQVTTKVLDDGGSSCSLATRWRINWRQYVAELAEVNVDCSSDARMYLAIYNTPQSSCQLFDELVDFQAKLRSQLSQLAATGKLSAALYNQIFRETDGLPVYISQNWTIQGDLNTKKFEALKIYYNFETHNYCHFILAILRDMLLKGTIFNIRTARDGEFYMASSWVPQPGYMDMEQGQESSEPTAKVDVLDNTEQIQLSDQPPKVIQATIISTKAELSVSLDLASEAIELTQAHKVIDDSSQALANELKLEDKASKTASIREQVVANMAALVSRLDRVERETTYKAPITLESSLSVSQASSSIEPSDLHFSVVAQERSFEPLLSKPLSVSQASESLLLDSVVFEPDEDINVNSQGFGSNKKSGKSFAQYLDRLKAAVEKKELVRSLNENSNEESQDYYEPLEDDGFFVEVWGSSLSDDESYVLEGFSAKSDFNRDPEEISKPNSESISSSISVINRFEKTQSLTEVNPSSAELMQELTLKSSPDLAIYISKEHKSSQVEESASDDSLLLIERLKSASEALSEAAATSISDVTSFEAIWPEADLGWGKVKAADVLSSLYDERKLPADNSQTEGKVIIETLADNIELEASMLERSRESEKKEERLEALTVSARSDLLEVKAPANSEGTFDSLKYLTECKPAEALQIQAQSDGFDQDLIEEISLISFQELNLSDLEESEEPLALIDKIVEEPIEEPLLLTEIFQAELVQAKEAPSLLNVEAPFILEATVTMPNPVDLEVVNLEPSLPKPINFDPPDSSPVGLELLEAKSISESSDSQIISLAPVEAKPIEAESIIEQTNSKPAKVLGTASAQSASIEEEFSEEREDEEEFSYLEQIVSDEYDQMLERLLEIEGLDPEQEDINIDPKDPQAYYQSLANVPFIPVEYRLATMEYRVFNKIQRRAALIEGNSSRDWPRFKERKL